MSALRSILPLIEVSKAVRHRSLNPPTVPAPPYNSLPPKIFGIGELGNVLTAIPGVWRGFGALSYVWHWERDGELIPGTENSTFYTYQPPDEFADITFVVTATDAIGQITTASSAPLVLTNLIQLEDAIALHTLVHVTMPEADNYIYSEESLDELSSFVNTVLPSNGYW